MATVCSKLEVGDPHTHGQTDRQMDMTMNIISLLRGREKWIAIQDSLPRNIVWGSCLSLIL